MSEPRTNTQKLLTLHVDAELFAAAEKARGRVNRSQWIRDAIAEKLAREGVKVPDEAALPPDRARKGGATWSEETLRKEHETPMAADAGDGSKLESRGPVSYKRTSKKAAKKRPES